MGYFLKAQCGKPDYRIVDSRGPWFLGASPFHIGWSGFYLLDAIVKLWCAQLFKGPFLAHVNITGRGSTIRKLILLALIRPFRVRYLLHVHDYDYSAEYQRRGPMLRSMIARAFRRAEKILVLGAQEGDRLSQLLGLPVGQVKVLPNGVPDPFPTAAKRRDDGLCHLLFLGHLSQRKGVPELLRALASPAVASGQWRATLAGGGPIEEFRRFTVELGIAERVDFPGWLDEARVRELCRSSDVLVLPSHAEGLAMAVLEGLSHGLAVITTPVGAHPEVIESEVSGILVPPGDVEALGSALARVIEDEGLRQRLSVGARRCYVEKFDVRSYAERLGALHIGLLERKLR
jgi:glycosyltransferase involved in cell wall biosynthesis